MFRAWYVVVPFFIISAFTLYFAVFKDVVAVAVLTVVLWFYFMGLRTYYEYLEMTEKVDKDVAVLMRAYKDIRVREITVELYNVDEYRKVKEKFLKKVYWWGKDDHDVCLDGVVPKRAVFDDAELVIKVFEDWDYVLCR